MEPFSLSATKVNLYTVHAAKEEAPPDIGFPTSKAESLSPSDTRRRPRPFFLPFARHAHSGRTLEGRREGRSIVEQWTVNVRVRLCTLSLVFQ